MTKDDFPTPDNFPGGFLVTDADRRILYASRYLKTRFGHDPDALHGRNIFEILTKASRIICESYIFPILLHEGQCEEINMVMLDAAGVRTPVIVNTALGNTEERTVYWCINSSVESDKLYQELLEVRRSLENKAVELQELSITDPLTGLLNRRELHRLARLIMASAKRSKRPASLLFLDIDHFKQVNDRQGHAAGDAILEQLGTVFRKGGRESDVISRYGGEEFVFLLPETGLPQAEELAGRLHQLVAGIETPDSTVTVSIGIGIIDDPEQADFKGLFELADQALYDAKTSGRNTTRIARG